jgi:hypothetical protein
MSISTPNRANGAPPTSAGLSEGLPQFAQDFVRKPRRLLIDGEWVEAVSGRTFETLNPATEESLGSVAHGAGADIGLAVRAARRCFDDERSDWAADDPVRTRQAGAGRWATTRSITTSKPKSVVTQLA